MADCDKIRELFDLYIDNEICETDRRELIKHLEDCEHCKSELSQLMEMVEEINKLPDIELPENFHSELMGRIKDEHIEDGIEHKKSRRLDLRWISSMAAALVLVVTVVGLEKSGLIGMMFNNGMDKSGAMENVAETQQIINDDGNDMLQEGVPYAARVNEGDERAVPEGKVQNRMFSMEGAVGGEGSGTTEDSEVIPDFEYVIYNEDREKCAEMIEEYLESIEGEEVGATEEDESVIEYDVPAYNCSELSQNMVKYGEVTFAMEAQEEAIMLSSGYMRVKVSITDVK